MARRALFIDRLRVVVVYTFWEPFVAWGIIAWLLVLFRERFNTVSPAWQSWGKQAYGAFILHPPIVVELSVALAGWAAPPALKFAIAGTGAIVISFAAATFYAICHSHSA